MSYHAYGASAEVVNPCGDNAFLDDSGTCQCLPGYIVPKPDAGCQPAVMGGAVTLQPVTIVGTPGGGPISTPAPMPAGPPTTAQKLNLASPWILGAAVGVLALVGLVALGSKRAPSGPYRATPNRARRNSGGPITVRHKPPAPDPYDTIKPGSVVTIVTPHGQRRTGRAVMRGPAGWVLNMGGPHGTPGIASPENVVAVRRGR